MIPDFRPLTFRIPLAEAVAETEEPLLRPGFFLVAPRAADGAIELKLLNRSQQGGNLQFVAADFAGCGMGQSPGDGLFDGADDQFRAEFLRAPVAEFNQLRKFVAGFDVEQRHRNVGWAKRLLR
jgi:hypothetical protein